MRNKNSTSGKTARQKLMKWAAVLYGTLIAAVFFALLSIVRSDGDDGEPTFPDTQEEEQVAAVLDAMKVHMPHIPEKDSIAIKYEPSWERNSIAPAVTDRPKIAIIIDDLGLAEDASFTLSQMVGPYTLAYLPYADNLSEQTEMVHRAGHELMVHMPMEPDSDNDPGPKALLTSLSEDEFAERVSWNLSRFSDYVGINNHMGSLMTEQAGPMVRLMVILRQRGLLFLDSLTSPKSVAAMAAKATGVPVLKRDIFLDNERTIAAIADQLQATEQIARRRGYAIAIGHPYEETLKALSFWQAGLEQRGITLVPISQLIRENAASTTHAENPVKPTGQSR